MIRTLRIAIIILLPLIITMVKDKFTALTKCSLVKDEEIKKKTQINIPRAFIEVRTADMGSRFAYDNHRKLHVEKEIQF